jgi:hypothetical protein
VSGMRCRACARLLTASVVPAAEAARSRSLLWAEDAKIDGRSQRQAARWCCPLKKHLEDETVCVVLFLVGILH